MSEATVRGADGLSFGREKRRLLAWLALAAPIPLPFSEVLEWPVLFLYAGLVVVFLQRVEQGELRGLPDWALNLLGLVYFPVFALDLVGSYRGGRVVTALLHLVMFLIAVKLFSLRREKDKWHLAITIFFLFLGSMATSSHVSIALYLLGFLALALFTLWRLADLHVLTRFGPRRPAATPVPPAAGRRMVPPAPGRTPGRRLLGLGILAVVLISIPIFAAAPRLREPFVLGRGESGMSRVTGFSDSNVDLSLTSQIRGNTTVVLRLKFDDEHDPAEMRFKGATFDHYDARRWHRTRQRGRLLIPTDDGRVEIMDGRVARKVEIFREPLRSTSLLLPLETLAVDLDRVPMVGLDGGGTVMLTQVPTRTLRYTADLGSEPAIAAMSIHSDEAVTLDEGGLTPRIRELADRVAGDGTPEEKIDRLERHLLTDYAYTLDFVGREGVEPLDDFLFVYRSGHCELFASALVLLLRSQGIPARLVTGFLGAEYNPIEGYYMVRQTHAHAWVEAYSPERGWRPYDPTPPEGRPAADPQTLALYVSQLYDFLTYRWDRYVLTYGADDQRSFFLALRDGLVDLWRSLVGSDGAEPVPLPAAAEEGPVVDGETARRGPWGAGPPLGLVSVVLAALLALLAWRQRWRPLAAGEAYRRLRDRLDRAGLGVTDDLAPLDLQSRTTARFPGTDTEVRRLVALYLRESFAGETLGSAERIRVRDDLHAVVRGIRDQLRREKKRRVRDRGAPSVGGI